MTRFFEPQTDAHLIQEVDVVVDALDNPDLKRRIVDLVKDCPNTESKVFAIRDYLNWASRLI